MSEAGEGRDMSKRVWTRLLPALSFVLLVPGIVGAQGILLLAHGGRADWNQKVLAVADQVASSVPVEVAFGMANKRTIRDALDRLAERDVASVVAVPLFVSSHSSVMRATEYLLGSRGEAPPQMAGFARMAARMHARRNPDAATGDDAGFDWTPRSKRRFRSRWDGGWTATPWSPRSLSPAPWTSARRRKKRSSWWWRTARARRRTTSSGWRA